MRYSIDREIIEKTRKCSRDFSCLENNPECMCSVEHTAGINKNILFISPSDTNDHCDYQMKFGNTFVCSCPTRLEIYKNYSV